MSTHVILSERCTNVVALAHVGDDVLLDHRSDAEDLDLDLGFEDTATTMITQTLSELFARNQDLVG